ncbi:Cytochrome oxidase assembly protein ShyY1 [Massilia sp. PDC64]|nr:SURF1 family protein [Massilia sp. PDC64]SDF31604.1 Cytochrome oxidase assembly protein ShyY1 [Massilia sp. PDC64]
MRLRFRFRTIPFLATLVLVAVGILLGNWQVRRAAEKTALQTRLTQRSALPPLVLDGKPLDPAAVEYRRVIVTGEFVPNWPLFLDNRPFEGRTGFIVLMPFKIAGGADVVLVARGWVPRDPAVHDRVPQVATPPGRTTIEGLAVLHPARVMELGKAPPPRPGAIVQNVDPAGFAQASGLRMLPVLVEQTNADGSGLTRKWPAPAVDVDRNKGYAFQWYALAAMAFLFFVITGFRSGTKQAG